MPPRDAIFHRTVKPGRKPPPKIRPTRGTVSRGIGQNAPPAPRVSRPTYEQQIHRGVVAGPARRQSKTIRAKQQYQRKAVQPAPKSNVYEHRISTGQVAGPSITKSRTVRSTPKPHPSLVNRLGHGLLDIITHPTRYVVGTSGVRPTTGHRAPGATAQSPVAGSPIESVPALALKNIGIATATHPTQVLPHTATGLAEIIAGVPAGIAGLTLHPSRLGQLPAAVGQDFSRRYGPLVHGDEAGFRQRLTQEGIAPELLDITAVGGSVAAGGGRAVGALARAGHLGERAAEFANAPRPALRISGNLAREQELSPNILRAGVQRVEDRARARVVTRRNRGELRRGIQPRRPEGPITERGQAARGGEVVPIFTNRAQRVATSKLSARSYIRNRHEQMQEIGKGLERDLAGLDKTERRAVFHVTSGLIPIHGSAEDIRAAVRARRAQITEHRIAHDVPDDPEVLKPSRELGALDFIDEHADKIVASQGLKDFHARTLERSQRLAELDPGLRNETARRHPYRVQGEALGVRYDPPVEGIPKTIVEKVPPDTQAMGQSAQRVRTLEAITSAAVEDVARERHHVEQGQKLYRELKSQGKSTAPIESRLADAADRLKHKEADLMAASDALKKARGAHRKVSQPSTRTREINQSREEYDREYIAQVQRKAKAAGLPEPVYFRHQAHPVLSPADRTAGNISRAIVGPKESELKLFREGRVYTGPEVLVSGLAKNIKRRHQWEGVADAFEQNALPFSRTTRGQGKSPQKILEELYRRRLDPRDYVFVNLGRFRREARSLGQAEEASNALRLETHDFDEIERQVKAAEQGDPEAQRFVGQQGLVAVPKQIADELRANTAAPNPVTRGFGKAMGIQSGVILGLNPSWLQMQVAANTLLTGIGTRGAFKDIAAQARYLKSLPTDQRRMIEENIGVGAFEGHVQTPHLGTVGDRSRLVQHARRVGQVPLVKFRGRAVRVTDTNPMRVMFRADNAQNNLFRKTVLYNAVKREAFARIRKETGLAQEAQARVANLLRLKPTEDVRAQIERVLANPKDIERLGEHTNNLLGDYLRFTARERRTFKSFTMFYGFFRYALRTLFYTLPVKHPIAAAIAGKLGQLHDEEIRDLFGTRDVPPWVYSRVFKTNANGKPIRNAQGQLQSIDLARINPVSSPLTNIVEESSAKKGAVFSPLIGMMSPLLQAGLDQAYARNSFTGRGFRVQGSAEENPAPDLPSRGRIVANQFLSSAFPYREAVKLTQRGTQGDDTLLGSPRPITYRTPGTQAQEAQRQANEPQGLKQVGQDLVPFEFPKGDTTEDYLKRHPPKDRKTPRSAPSILDRINLHRGGPGTGPTLPADVLDRINRHR